MAHDLRAALCLVEGHAVEPGAAFLDSRTLRSTPEGSARTGYGGAEWQKGPERYAAADTHGGSLALYVTLADAQGRTRGGQLAAAAQEVTDKATGLAYADRGYTGEALAEDAEARSINLEIIKLFEARRGLILLPRKRDIERSFACATRFRQLAHGHKRLPQTGVGPHFAAIITFTLAKAMCSPRLQLPSI